MIPFVVILAIVTMLSGQTKASYPNKFEATRGCLQYNSDKGYNNSHVYFSTGAYRHVRKGPNNATELWFGVLGKMDAIFRLAPVQYPYDRTRMNEIVLSGWGGVRCDIRSYVRTSPTNLTDYTTLTYISCIGLMSPFEPVMFTLAAYPSGSVKLTKDGDTYPFLEFRDQALSTRYIGLTNWDVPVVFFFDCPHYR